MDTGQAYQAFGVGFRFDFPVPELRGTALQSGSDGPEPECRVQLSEADQVRTAFSGRVDTDAVGEADLGDGFTSRIERGHDGDHLLTYGDRAVLHISAAHDRLVCAPRASGAPEWRRYLHDTGLATVALLRGFEALHAGAVVGDNGVVAVVAGQGGGKSTLVAELMRRGHPLFCDDVLTLSHDGARVVGHAGPALMNLAPVLPDGTLAASIGRVIATVAGECWVAVDGPPTTVEPVAAIVLLDRGAHAGVSIDLLPRSPVALLAQSLRSGRSPNRLAARLQILGDLSTSARQLHLRAPIDASAADVADVLTSALAQPRSEV